MNHYHSRQVSVKVNQELLKSADALAWYVFFQRGTLERVPVAPETVYPARVTDPTVAVSLASLLRGVV